MLRGLISFSYQRTVLQAFGWYLIFLVLAFSLGALEGFIFARGATSMSEAMQKFLPLGMATIVVYHIALGVALLWSREKTAFNVSLVIAAVVVSFPLGAAGGLIALAVLTTRPLQKSRAEIGEVFE
jgi:hypothetical protein